ncbi:hypothetical protein BH10PSE15_BH10PSE15_08200 [soil metagenome]
MLDEMPIDRWHALTEAVHQLSRSETLIDAIAVLRTCSRTVVGADGVTIVRRESAETVYVAEDAPMPFWEGRRFPIKQCLAGFAILEKRPVIIADVRRADNVPQNAYMATYIESVAVLPVGLGEPVGAIGAYWREARQIDDETVALLAALARAFGAVIELFAVLEQAQCASERARESARATYSAASSTGAASVGVGSP